MDTEHIKILEHLQETVIPEFVSIFLPRASPLRKLKMTSNFKSLTSYNVLVIYLQKQEINKFLMNSYVMPWDMLNYIF